MKTISNPTTISDPNRSERALKLRNETIAYTIARLFQMLVDIYGTEIKSLDKIKKWEGSDVELYFKALDTGLTLNLSKNRLTPYLKPSEKSVATVIMAMDRERIIPDIVDLIRTKNNFMGLIKVIIKYVLTRKIRIKGSLGAAIKVIKLLSIGTHPSYKYND